MLTTALMFNLLNPVVRLLAWLSLLITCFATNAFAGQVNLAWNASSGSVAGYRVYYGTVSGNYTAKLDSGAATTATLANLTDSATYYFAVKAYDGAGNESSFSNEAVKTPTSSTGTPVSSFSATPVSGVAPLLVTLSDTSTGSVTSRVWDFGDGTTSTSQSAMKTYNTAGVYTVKLTVGNTVGKSTTSKTITVTSALPKANFTATPTTGTVPLTVQVADTSTNATGWNWNFGDGTTSNLQTPPVHIYKTAGTYTVRLIVTGPGGTSTAKITTITAKEAETATLPSPWLSMDIGAVNAAGSVGYTNGTYTLKGAGTIWYGVDAFNFAYQPISGDGTIIARVASLTATNDSAKVGVMIRENLNADARHVMVKLTPKNGVMLQQRLITGQYASNVGSATINKTAPYWVKLTRAGNLFTAHHSPDGVTWTMLASTTINMAANAYVGLALASGDNTKLANSTFDKVTFK